MAIETVAVAGSLAAPEKVAAVSTAVKARGELAAAEALSASAEHLSTSVSANRMVPGALVEAHGVSLPELGRVVREARLSDEALVLRDTRAAEQIRSNYEAGKAREAAVKGELEEQYPASEGYEVLSERTLVDSEGRTVVDPETGTRRRVDFVVVKDGEVIDMVEVTSESAPKAEQLEKGRRIRESGGTYVKHPETGELIEIPEDVQTRVERRA